MATNTTNKTSKLGLSQYSANDYISFLTNYNSDMAAIDNSIGANNGIAGLNSNGKLAQMPTPSDIGAVPTSLKINSHALTSDLTLTPSDIGAATAAQGAKADSAVQSNQIGVANGVASLDADGIILKSQFPMHSNLSLVFNNMEGNWTGTVTGGMRYIQIGELVHFWLWFYISTVGNGGNMAIQLPKTPIDYYQFNAYKTQLGVGNPQPIIPASQFIFANLNKNKSCMGFTPSGSGYTIATGAYYCDGVYITSE